MKLKTELEVLAGCISTTILSVTGRKVQADALARAMRIIGANLIKVGSDVFPPWKPDPVYTDEQEQCQSLRIAALERWREWSATTPGSIRERDLAAVVISTEDLLDDALDKVTRGDCGEFIYPNGFTFPLEWSGAVMQACKDFHHGQSCPLYILQCDSGNATPSRLAAVLVALKRDVEAHTERLESAAEAEVSDDEWNDEVTYRQALDTLARWSMGASAPLKDHHGNTFALVGLDECECGCKYWDNDQCHSCGVPHFTLKLGQGPEAQGERMTTTTTSQGTFGTDCGCDYDIAHGCPSMSGGPCETTHGLTLPVLDDGPEGVA
jgi:hypothetical protein